MPDWLDAAISGAAPMAAGAGMAPMTGGLSLAAAGLSSGINFFSQQQTNASNVQQAQVNRDFQERMSSTAYQRSVSDMKAAGLNPAMMFGHGGPESSPSGAQAELRAPQVEPGAVDRAVSTAVQLGVAQKTIDKLSEEVANVRAQTATEEKRPALLSAQIETERQRPSEVEAHRNLMEDMSSLSTAERDRLLKLGPSFYVQGLSAQQEIDFARAHPSIYAVAKQSAIGGELVHRALSPALAVANTFSVGRMGSALYDALSGLGRFGPGVRSEAGSSAKAWEMGGPGRDTGGWGAREVNPRLRIEDWR